MAFRRLFPSRSLFVTSLLFFICIIVLFSLFNGVSFIFFKSKLEEEIIASNRMLLQHSAERYANHFSRLQTLLYSKYKETDVQSFNRQIRLFGETGTDYLTAKKISSQLRTEANDPLFYLESLILHFGGNAFAIDQEGSSSAEDMLGRAYQSSIYTYTYWQNQLLTDNTLTLLPAVRYNRSVELPHGSKLMPFVYKTPGSQYQIIAMLNMEKTQHALFGDERSRTFAITSKDGLLLYSSDAELNAGSIPTFGEGESHLLINGQYWFRTSDSSGLRYFTRVPAQAITSQLSEWNFTAAVVLALTLIIGIAASILFSKRLELPVKQLVDAFSNKLQDKQPSPIEEYAFIDRNIKELLKEREEVQAKMAKQRTLLTNFGYMSQLKNINEDIVELEQLQSMNESYTVVLYELRFRGSMLSVLNLRPETATLAIREHIRHIAQEHCPSSHTFQMEKNYILTVIKESKGVEIEGMLEKMKGMLDQCKHYCLATIAVSARFEHPSQLGYAYEQVQMLSRQAKLLDETQLILEARELPDPPRLTLLQEQELVAAIQGGQGDAAFMLIDSLLEDMYAAGAAALQYEAFSTLVFEKVAASLGAMQLDASQSWAIKPLHYKLAACCTLSDYKEVLSRLLEAAAVLMIENRADTFDPIAARVMEIIEKQFAEELSLDYLAQTLNMSSAYLSAYIKEKTGTNFSEHLNSLRVSKAKELLTGTTLNINDISRQVGYHNVTSFNRMFKKGTGLAPSEYRKQSVLERKIG